MRTSVLISSAGRRVSLAQAFANELGRLHPSAEIITADANPRMSAACQLASRSVELPRLGMPHCIDVLFEVCQRYDVGLLIPTIDPELPLLAAARQRFVAAGIHVVVSDSGFVEVCADKRRTAEFFAGHGIATPHIIDRQAPTFPLFARPYDGSNSVGARLVCHAGALTQAEWQDEGLLLTEYFEPVEYAEYTIDMYYNNEGVLCCAVPRERLEVRGGEISKGITRPGAVIQDFTHALQRIPGARGCITAQCFVHRKTGRLVANEINARFGGGYPLSYAAGANYPRWLIQEYLHGQSIVAFNAWKPDLLMLRHDREVFVDAAAH